MNERKIIVVDDISGGERLDSFVAKKLDISRNSAAILIEESKVELSGKTLRKNHRVSADEIYTVVLPEVKELAIAAEDIPLDILFEDEHLLVINKVQGMVVHPAAGNWSGTLVNALLSHCGDSLSGINGVHRPGIVHRLDKDTSGVMLVAKTDAAHRSLANQIQLHTVERVYHTIIVGHLRQSEGSVNMPIGRNTVDRKKMCITSKNSKEAITHYKVIEEYPGFSYVQCKLETGRTHQIRVHMSYLGHPVLGDTVYGSKKNQFGLKGQCLHSKNVLFKHPITEKEMFFDSELPEYFKNVICRINK